ncbi:MAG: autotransporter outer membrane beta-barrel domain-containing protein [Puniceicoccales bacterium]|jgi:hypothetical protein|nr:autotransporter outer membrane beta-barrel domain-containing protein [Puniceicoccales bacterium]
MRRTVTLFVASFSLLGTLSGQVSVAKNLADDLTRRAYAVCIGVPYNPENDIFNCWNIETIGSDGNLDVAAIAFSTNSSGENAYAAAIGAAKNGSRNLDGGMNSFNGWNFGGFGSGNRIAAFACDGSDERYPYSALVGAGEMQRGDGSFNRWTIGNCGSGNWLAAAGGDSCLFGVGENHGSSNIFNGWTLGNFARDNTLYSGASLASRSSNGSIFGAGENIARGSGPWNEFNGWTFGNFADGNALVAHICVKNAAGFAGICAFGSSWGGKTGEFCNWTAEFQGNALLAATSSACPPKNVTIGTLGGYRNGGMRFYFNDLDAKNPVVAIVGAKLSDPWTIEGDVAKNSFGFDQGTGSDGDGWGDDAKFWARAVAIGPNFQLNIGRTRRMEDSWLERALGHESPQNGNGSWETDKSIASGGFSVDSFGNGIGPGTLHIVGAISSAAGNGRGVQAGSAMRIDSGWTVNCYGPVQDFETIAILKGKLVLLSSQGLGADAIAAIGRSMAYLAVDELGNFACYQNSTDGTGAKRGDSFAGTVALDGANYPTMGRMDINAGQTLLFGLDPENKAASGKIVCGDIGLLRFESCPRFLAKEVSYGETGKHYIFKIVENMDATAISGDMLRMLQSIIIGYDEYANYENLQLHVDQIESTLQLVGTLEKIPTAYAKCSFAAPLAEVQFAAVNMLCDEVCNGISNKGHAAHLHQFFGHGHRAVDGATGLGFSADFRTIVLGVDRFVPVSRGQLHCGLSMSHGRNDLEFFGPNALLRRSAAHRDFSGKFSAHYGYTFHGWRNIDARATIGLAAGRNKTSRQDASGDVFAAKFGDRSIFLHCECCGKIATIGTFGLGPWLASSYENVHQLASCEERLWGNGDGSSIALSPTDHHMLATTVGVALERRPTGSQSALSFSGKIGWRLESGHHSTGTAYLEQLGPYHQLAPGGSRGCLALSGGLRVPFCRHWTGQTYFHCYCNRKNTCLGISLTIGCAL